MRHHVLYPSFLIQVQFLWREADEFQISPQADVFPDDDHNAPDPGDGLARVNGMFDIAAGGHHIAEFCGHGIGKGAGIRQNGCGIGPAKAF